jgi:hypothetical protein
MDEKELYRIQRHTLLQVADTQPKHDIDRIAAINDLKSKFIEGFHPRMDQMATVELHSKTYFYGVAAYLETTFASNLNAYVDAFNVAKREAYNHARVSRLFAGQH